VLNRSAVLISLPQLAEFDIHAPETIQVGVNSSIVTFGSVVTNVPSFEVAVLPGTAVLTVQSSRLSPFRDESALDEGALQSRTNMLVVTLLNDTWVEGLGADCNDGAASVTLALLDQLVSAQAEPAGWNAQALPSLGCSNVFRNSTTVLSVVLPPLDRYEISAPETITMRIPPLALTSSQYVWVEPALIIAPTPVQALLGGSFLSGEGRSEEALSTIGTYQLVISLVVRDATQTAALPFGQAPLIGPMK
jgi:hypothetical protein